MNLHKNDDCFVGEAKIKIGFMGATCSLIAIYAASSAPIPLYSTYHQTIGFTNAEFSLSAVAYFAGTVLALLMFARLSNYLGRRPVALWTLGLALVGCLLFIFISNMFMFLTARLLQGLACGLASSTIAAYAIDNAKGWIGAAVTSGAPMFGLAVGAFGSGALKEYSSGSLVLIFGIIMVVIIGCAILILAGPETVKYSNGAITSLIPQIKVNRNIRRLLPAASSTFIGTWAIGGFYQAFSSSLAVENLHTTNTLVAAAVFACLMAPSTIGGVVAGRLKPNIAQRIGMLAFFMCVITILVSLNMGATVPFLIASALAGSAWGIAFTGSMQSLLEGINQEDRAGVLSTIFLISYSGAAVPNLIVGNLGSYFSLLEIADGYGALVGVACIMTLFTANPRKPKSAVEA